MATEEHLTTLNPDTEMSPNGTVPLTDTGEASEITLGTAPRRKSLFRRTFRRPSAILAGIGLVLFVLLAIFGPWISPFDPDRQDLTATFQEPSSEHWFGTDALGRDQLSRVIAGARVSLLAALQAASISVIIGAPLGVIAGYRGGRFDAVVSRIVDGMMAIPGLIFALSIISVLGPGLTNAMLAIGILLIPTFFRVTRASTLDVRSEPYIESSTAIGCSETGILLRHVVPNIASPFLVMLSLTLGIIIVVEASLSFLGLGARPPTASWGGMLSDASGRLDKGYLIWPPGVAIVLAVATFTYLGDALRDALGVDRSAK